MYSLFYSTINAILVTMSEIKDQAGDRYHGGRLCPYPTSPVGREKWNEDFQAASR